MGTTIVLPPLQRVIIVGSIMSSIALDPIPLRFPGFAPGNNDTRGWDFTQELSPIGDTIASATVAITRVDGAVMGSGDLAIVGSVVIDVTHLIVTFALTASLNDVDYLIALAATRTSGRIETHAAFFYVTAFRA